MIIQAESLKQLVNAILKSGGSSEIKISYSEVSWLRNWLIWWKKPFWLNLYVFQIEVVFLDAMEAMYQRIKIQEESLYYETL